MCGFNGLFAYGEAAPALREAELLATRDSMKARGPDGAGLWWSQDRRCGLGHRRLAILDLSDRGAQPMASADGAHIVAFNGEIYNYPELRAELEAQGVTFRTGTDTEALLHLYKRDGADMAARLRGMFAFAIWDVARAGVFLARDSYGMKPLYLADDGRTLRFASQVKALLAGGALSRDPDPAGMAGFYIYGSVPEPFTCFSAIRAFPPGCSQWVDHAGARAPVRFHSIAGTFSGAIPGADDTGAIIRAACLDSVRAHLLADVSVGLFLSAGIDSGALLGLMADCSAQDTPAITLAFDEYAGSPADEAPLAAQVAAHYGARHTVRRVGEAEFHRDLPLILDAMDQPSIDGINTWFVAKATREAGLKVALSGLGADELLGGYPAFRDVPRWARWLGPAAAIPGLGVGLRRAATSLGMFAAKPKARAMVEYGGSFVGAYFLRRALFLPFELEQCLSPDLLREGLATLSPLARLNDLMTPDPHCDFGRVSALESGHYMRNQLLRDADWAGMAHGLEIRTPFVDTALLAAIAPIAPRLSGRAGKLALAAAPSRSLPDIVARRAKTGFTLPISRWISAAAQKPAQARVQTGLSSRAWAAHVMQAHTESQARL